MTLLSPAALLTLAALALPLALHLWRRPPRTVLLGSLRFLQHRPGQLRDLRWREYALLCARLGLLAALALGLARPEWRRPAFSRPQRWVLLDPAAAPAGPSLRRLRVLRAAGGETRLLAPGFPGIDAPPASGSAPDLWSLLRELDAALPVGSSATVFTPGELAELRGVRPGLTRLRIEWVHTPAAPLTNRDVDDPPPAPLAVLILHDPDRAGDARYVAAAWRAVAAADRRTVNVTVGLSSDAPAGPAADWVFWLGRAAAPPAVAVRAANLLEDAAGPAADVPPGWIVSALPPVRLWRRGLAGAGAAVWSDGFGQGLLTRTREGHATRWHFASRFDPAWNDLPLGSALPAALRTLVAPPASVLRADGRLADPSQLLPSDLPAAASAPFALPGEPVDLRAACWLAAAALFCLERLLSHRRVPAAAPPLAAASFAAAPSAPVLSR